MKQAPNPLRTDPEDQLVEVVERRLAARQHPISWLYVTAVLVGIAMAVHLLITNPNFQWSVVGQYFFSGGILSGLVRTLELTAISMLVGIILGVVAAVTRMSNIKILAAVASFYIWFFRGTPLLVQIIFWYNLSALVKRISIGIPFGPSFVSWSVNTILTAFIASIVALSLNQGAYMAEIVRAGIESIDTGQEEAATALGLTRARTFRRIILPQAMRLIVPPTGNQLISLLKDSSLVSVTALPELLYSAQLIYQQTFQTIPLLIVASLWYLVATTVLSVPQYYLERHFARGSARALPLTPWQKMQAFVKSRGMLINGPK